MLRLLFTLYSHSAIFNSLLTSPQGKVKHLTSKPGREWCIKLHETQQQPFVNNLLTFSNSDFLKGIVQSTRLWAIRFRVSNSGKSFVSLPSKMSLIDVEFTQRVSQYVLGFTGDKVAQT